MSSSRRRSSPGRPSVPVGSQLPSPWADGALDVAGLSRQGPRAENQDAWMVEPRWGVMALADGCGGEGVHGGFAANAVVASVRTSVRSGRHQGPVKALWDAAADKLRGDLARVGWSAATTLIVVQLHPLETQVVWSGDSGLFTLSPRGTFQRRTRFHNLAGVGLDAGQMTEDEYRGDRRRRILLAHLSKEPKAEYEVLSTPGLQPGEVALVLTDGLFDPLGSERIGDLLRRARADGASAVQMLEGVMEAAETEGLKDNATRVVVYRRGPPSA